MATQSKRTFIRIARTVSYPHGEVKAIIREARTALDPEYPICVNVKMLGGDWPRATGWAYSRVPLVSNAPQTARRLITAKLPQPHARYPMHNLCYPGKENSSRDWPTHDVHSWQEDFFHLMCHEFAHCRQYDENRPCSEIDADRRAGSALRRWREAGCPGASFKYFDMVQMAKCSPDSPAIPHPRDSLAQSEWLATRLERLTGIKLPRDLVEVAAETWWTEIRADKGTELRVAL